MREFMTHISIQPDGRLERAEQEARRLTTEVAGLAAAVADAKAEVSRLQEAMLESSRELLERRREAEALAAQLRDARRACELEAKKSDEATRQLETEKQRSLERLGEIRALEKKHEAAQQQAAADLEQAEARARSKVQSETQRAQEERAAQEAEAQRESSEVQALRGALAEAEAALARRRDVVNRLQQTEASEEREEIARLRKEVDSLKSRESELLRQLDETLAQNSITSEDKQCQTDAYQEKARVRSPEPVGKQDAASMMGDVGPRQGTGGLCVDPEGVDGNDEMVDYPRVLAMGGGWLQGVSLSWRGKLRQHSKQTQTSRSPSASPPGSKTPKQRTRSPDRERLMPFELTAEGLSRGRSPQPQPFPKTAKVLLPLTAKAKRSTVCRSPPRLHLNNPGANPKAEAQRQAQVQTRPSRSPESREKASNRAQDVERPRKAWHVACKAILACVVLIIREFR